MNWSSKHPRVYEEMDDFYDLETKVGNYKPRKNKMTGHNLKILGGLAIVFIIGGLQALKGLNVTNGLETVIPVLLAIEHALYGNS